MKRGILTLLVLGLGIVTITSGISAKTPVESLVERLPDNTLGFIATSGGDFLAEPFNQSMLGQLWHDPGVQQFFQQIKIMGNMKDGLSGFTNEIWPIVKFFLRRPCVFGTAINTSLTKKDSSFYYFVIIHVGDNKAEVEAFIRKHIPSFYEGNITEVKIGSHMMFTDTEPNEGPEESYWGWVGDYLVLGFHDPEGLSLKYLDPSIQPPKSNRIPSMQKIKPHGDLLVFFLDCKKLWQPNCPPLFNDNKGENFIRKIRSILGFDSLQTINGRIGFDGQDIVNDTLLEISSSSIKRGLLNCFKPVDVTMLDYVEPQASSATIVNLDLAGLYDTLLHCIKEFASDPDEIQEIEQAIQAAETKLGFQIRRELLENLAGPIMYYMFPSGISMEIPSGGLIFMFQLRDAKKIESCLNQVDKLLHQYSQSDGGERGMIQVNTVQQAGKTLHVWTIAPLAMFSISPTWTVTDNQLIFATHPFLVRHAVQQIENPNRHNHSIRTTSGYQQVIKDLPKNLLSLRYTNTPVAFRHMFTLMQRFWPFITMGMKKVGITLPPLQPTLDPLIEKMGPSYVIFWSDSKGYHIHNRGPLPTSCDSGGNLITNTALAISIMLPALSRARELANRVECAAQLRGLGNAIAMYNNDFNDKYPKTIQELIETEDVSPKRLICYSSDDEVGQCSYIYRGADLNASSDSSMIVAYDKFDNHYGEARNVLFAGGHVERLEEEAFQELIRKDNELRRKMGLAEIPADVEPVPPKKKRPLTFE